MAKLLDRAVNSLTPTPAAGYYSRDIALARHGNHEDAAAKFQLTSKEPDS
jgi:hypothetical protein